MPAYRLKPVPTSRDPSIHRDFRAHRTLYDRRRKHLDKYHIPGPITPELIKQRTASPPHVFQNPLPTTLRQTFKQLKWELPCWIIGNSCRCEYCLMFTTRTERMIELGLDINEGVALEPWLDSDYIEECFACGFGVDIERRSEEELVVGHWQYYWSWLSALQQIRGNCGTEDDLANFPTNCESFASMMKKRHGELWCYENEPQNWLFKLEEGELVFGENLDRAILEARSGWIDPAVWSFERRAKDVFGEAVERALLKAGLNGENHTAHSSPQMSPELWEEVDEAETQAAEAWDEVDKEGVMEWDVVSISSIADASDQVALVQGEPTKQCAVM